MGKAIRASQMGEEVARMVKEKEPFVIITEEGILTACDNNEAIRLVLMGAVTIQERFDFPIQKAIKEINEMAEKRRTLN